MLLAYLEGASSNIITPKYTYGLRSIWREQLLLEAVNKKHLANQLLQNIQHDTQFISVLKTEALPKFAEDLRKQTLWLNRILMMELDAASPEQKEDKAKNLVKIYNTLEKSGILEEVATLK